MNTELQQHITKQKRIAAAKDAMKELIDCTNKMGIDDDDVIQGMTDALQCSHRTLQQSFMRCFVGTMKNYSTFRTDARNEGAVNFAKKITEMEYHFSFI